MCKRQRGQLKRKSLTGEFIDLVSDYDTTITVLGKCAKDAWKYVKYTYDTLHGKVRTSKKNYTFLRREGVIELQREKRDKGILYSSPKKVV